MTPHNSVTCPQCTHQFTVEDAIYSAVQKETEARLRQKMQDWQRKREAEYKQKQEALEQNQKLQQQEAEKAFEKQRQTLAHDLRQRIERENNAMLEAMQKEADRQADTINSLKMKEVEFMEKEKQLRVSQEEMELSKKKWELEKQAELEDRIRKIEENKNELKFREYEKQLKDQKELVEEMRRKAEQGSMQLQGEVQELAMEEWLRAKFPFDTIDEIKKGARGGDCTQTVMNKLGQHCGIIYYESKRTKDFQPSWIEKFKEDMRDIGAEVGVIVTQAMPKDMERFGQREGIWICTYEEFKALCFVLRDSLVRVQQMASSQENKDDKMVLLYNYLTSNGFRMSIEAIVEAFTTMKDDLERERNAMQRIWKSREKQIEKVMTSTIDMYGSVRGIAGSAIQEIKVLELGGNLLLEE